MTSRPDAKLMELNARFTYVPEDPETEGLDVLRAKSRELGGGRKGAHADKVSIDETEWGAIFRPLENAKDDASIIYIHGGGWCRCDLVTHRTILQDLAALSGRTVYGVTYPLAPEHPYPAGQNAVHERVQLIAKEATGALILGGDSAGANLSLATALRLRDEGKDIQFAALLLWYGCYRYKFDTRSHLAYGDGSCGLATAGMREMWDFYLAGPGEKTYAELSDADVSGLPPSYLCEAECDCLADDTRWLASKMMEVGVSHHYDFYPNATHGFIHYGAYYAPSFATLERAARFVEMIVGKS